LKQIIRNTISILTPAERRKQGILTGLDILISIIDILSLALLVFIIHFYTQPIQANIVSFLPSRLLDHNSVLLITLFFLFFSIKNLAGFMIYKAQYRFLCGVASRISQSMLKKYLEGNYTDYVNIDSAIHIRRINHHSIDFSQHILGGIQQIITQIVLIFLAIIAIVIFNAKIFLLLMILLLPPVLAIFYFIKKKLRSVKISIKKSSERSLQYLYEALSAFVESNVYNKNDFFLRRYVSSQQEFNKHHAELSVVQGMPSRLIEIFALLGLFMLIAINKWSGSADSATVVTIGAFMAAAYRIIPGIVKILNLSTQVTTYSHTINDLLQATAIAGKKNQNELLKNIRSVRFSKLSFQYNDRLLFKDFDLMIKPGDFLGLAGSSGIGKTTILNLLLGFLQPHKGEVVINDEVADCSALKEYWPAIAYVKQQNFLIHDSILRNITLDDELPDGQKLQEVVRISGLTELISTLPEGLHTIITENGKNISGGQRQRIAIARALYKNADLVILDEPFNELDEKSEHCLLQYFKHLSETGKLIILITHHKKSLSFCNKIVSLDA
jgi:ABC-type multidrug transport system fused ATPase/permease subunit